MKLHEPKIHIPNQTLSAIIFSFFLVRNLTGFNSEQNLLFVQPENTEMETEWPHNQDRDLLNLEFQLMQATNLTIFQPTKSFVQQTVFM